MTYPICNECKSPLTGRIRYHWTVCPQCGRRWQLDDGNAAIKSVTLEVHPGRHLSQSKLTGVSNGEVSE